MFSSLCPLSQGDLGRMWEGPFYGGADRWRYQVGHSLSLMDTMT